MAQITNEVIIKEKQEVMSPDAEKLRDLTAILNASYTSYWTMNDVFDPVSSGDTVEIGGKVNDVTKAEMVTFQGIKDQIRTILNNSGNANLIDKFCVREIMIHTP